MNEMCINKTKVPGVSLGFLASSLTPEITCHTWPNFEYPS